MFVTTVPDSTQSTRASYSEHSSGFTLLKNLKAPESGWRQFSVLSVSTEAEFGPRRSAKKALLSISLSAKSQHQRPVGQTRARAPSPRDSPGMVVTLCSSEESKAVTREASDLSASQHRTPFDLVPRVCRKCIAGTRKAARFSKFW